MPRQRWMKSTLVQAIVFIGVLVIVGHLSVNFWERFIIQSELTQMRASLHSLKETLAHIGNAYDNLHHELKGLADVTEKKHLPARFKNTEPEHKCKSKHTLDRRRLHDIHVRSLLLAAKEQEKALKANKTTNNTVRMESKKLEAVLKPNPIKNATTITRYPPKSTGVGQDKCSAIEHCRHTFNDGHKCYRDYDYSQAQHPYNNWKY